MNDLYYESASSILQHIHNGNISVKQVMLALLDRISAINKQINALVCYNEADLLFQAEQADKKIASQEKIPPLLGLPISIKDNIEVKDMQTTGGIEGRKNYIPSADATIVKRLRAAGAIIIGKTNCPAYCAGYETTNKIYGRTNNPYDVTRTVGSSSGGEAALIAAGGSYLGFGSDSGGSIRWPANFCGIAGLVPTFGRVPRTGTIPPYLGCLDTTQIGPMARCVRDLILSFSIIMGPDNWDPRCVPLSYEEPDQIPLDDLHIAYYTDNGYVTPEPSVRQVIGKVADVLAETDLIVKESCPSPSQKYLNVIKGLNSFGQNIEPQTEPDTGEIEKPIELYPDNIYLIADDWLERSKSATGDNAMLGIEYYFWTIKWDTYRSAMLRFMDKFDAIITPLAAKPAFKHGASSKDDFNGLELLSYTHPYSLVGLPSVTLCGGYNSAGLPIGLQILTRHGKEDLALKLGLYLEEKLQQWQNPTL